MQNNKVGSVSLSDGPQGYLLGLNGKMHSGKSTLAKTLVETRAWEVVSFASSLKLVTRRILTNIGFSEDQAFAMTSGDLKGVWMPATGISTRRIMQVIGTEYRMMIGRQSLWCDIAIAVAREKRKLGVNVVIDDVRFEHPEMDAIRSEGGMVWSIRRPGHTNPAIKDSDTIDLIHSARAVPMLSRYTKGVIEDVFNDAFSVLASNFSKIGITGADFDKCREAFSTRFVAEYVLPIMTKAPSDVDSGVLHVASEVDYPATIFDRVIYNDGTLLDFRSKVNETIARLDLKAVSDVRAAKKHD